MHVPGFRFYYLRDGENNCSEHDLRMLALPGLMSEKVGDMSDKMNSMAGHQCRGVLLRV